MAYNLMHPLHHTTRVARPDTSDVDQYERFVEGVVSRYIDIVAYTSEYSALAAGPIRDLQHDLCLTFVTSRFVTPLIRQQIIDDAMDALADVGVPNDALWGYTARIEAAIRGIADEIRNRRLK